MIEKPTISLPIIVEGRYDKNTLLQIFSATVITLDGFGVFNSKEKQALIRKISERGVIVLCDSDGGGKQIRSFLNGILKKEKVYNLYIPRIEGKERRKKTPSKEGLLGVEGMPREVLLSVFAPFIEGGERAEKNIKEQGKMITKVDFYKDGLTGTENSSLARDALAAKFGLPPSMTANALLEALNIVTDLDGYREALGKER